MLLEFPIQISLLMTIHLLPTVLYVISCTIRDLKQNAFDIAQDKDITRPNIKIRIQIISTSLIKPLHFICWAKSYKHKCIFLVKMFSFCVTSMFETDPVVVIEPKRLTLALLI